MYNLDFRCRKLLLNIIEHSSGVSPSELCETFDVSRRTIYNDFNKINEWLIYNNFDSLEYIKSTNIIVFKDSNKDLIKIHSLLNNQYYLSPEERVYIIICEVINRPNILGIEYFTELLKVSKNTVVSDLKDVTVLLEQFSLKLLHKNKHGYYIQGKSFIQCSVFFSFFLKIIDIYRNNSINYEYKDQVESLYNKLKEIENNLDTKYVLGTLFAIANFFANSSCRSLEIMFSNKDKIEISKTREYKLCCEYLSNFDEDEIYYIALLLLGSRLQTSNLILSNETEKDAYKYAELLVNEFERVACISINDKINIINSLTIHLKTSLYRYYYGIHLENPMLENIKTEYSQLFEITKKSCEKLEHELGTPISEGEIAYITLHFGKAIHNAQAPLKILILCPDGISTGSMLLQEIRLLCPLAHSIDIKPYSNDIITDDYNVVISTIFLETKNNFIKVNPILTNNDRREILKLCFNNGYNNQFNYKSIIDLARKYIDKDKIHKFSKELEDILFNAVTTQNENIINYLNHKYIKIIDKEYNFYDAIKLASIPLIEDHIIEERYVSNIIDKCNKYGPYMFINNDVILACSKVEDGSLKLGFSLYLFKNAFKYDDTRNVKIVIVLSTTDPSSHFGILEGIYNLFTHENIIEKFDLCKDEYEIINMIKTILSNSYII